METICSSHFSLYRDLPFYEVHQIGMSPEVVVPVLTLDCSELGPWGLGWGGPAGRRWHRAAGACGVNCQVMVSISNWNDLHLLTGLLCLLLIAAGTGAAVLLLFPQTQLKNMAEL